MANPKVTITATSLAAAFRRIGRGRLFLRGVYWDGTDNFDDVDGELGFLADSDGDTVLDPKESLSILKAKETTGEAPLAVYVDGGAPDLSTTLFLADPALRAKLTPLGESGGAGYSIRREAVYRTLVAIPEQVFVMADGSLGLLKYDHLTTSWTVGGIAATAEQLRLIDWSIWLWKVVPNRPKVSHKHSEGNAATDTINWTIVQDMTKPEGQQLYTIGDPEEYGININPITA